MNLAAIQGSLERDLESALEAKNQLEADIGGFSREGSSYEEPQRACLLPRSRV
jgi:hypothetical protein